VANGAIQIPFGDGIGNNQGAGTANGLFTQTFVNTGITANSVTMFTGAMPMAVGFTFTSQGKPVRPFTPQETGTRSGPDFGKWSRQHYIMVQVEGVAGPGGLAKNWPLTLGANLDSTQKPAYFKTQNKGNLRIDQQFSGVFRDQFTSDYDFETSPAWQVTRPYICNMRAIGAALETADV
jgi:hypothetical protein